MDTYIFRVFDIRVSMVYNAYITRKQQTPKRRNTKMKKRIISLIAAAASVLALTAALASCGGDSNTGTETTAGGSSSTETKKIEIAVPNDTTNEARALQLLEQEGIIKLREGAGITATVSDIIENPKNITFREVEAAQLPNILRDVSFAVINSNYAIPANLSPTKDSLAIEGSYSAYSNIIAVKEGNESSDLTKALVAAASSQKVKDYIEETYQGNIVSVVSNPTDGFDSSVDYDALKGQTIKIAASPSPHAEILGVVKTILAEKDITLDIVEFTDYVQPNNVVESGDCYANYFQHQPYLDDFNKENGTHVVSVASIHVEPMGIYAGKETSLDILK